MSLRKLANIFVDLGPEPPPPATKPDKSPAPATTGAQRPVASVQPAPVATPGYVASPGYVPVSYAPPAGQIDPDMLKILEDAITEANMPGFDYLEFRDVLANMASIPMPEPQKFQAAFASAQVAKITKQQLLEAVDFYLKVIDTKTGEWNDYVAGVKLTEVDGKGQQIADIEAEIEKHSAQIQELTKKILELRAQQDAIRLGQTQAESDIRNKNLAFEATKAAVVARLTADRQKIDSYIQG